MASETSNGRVFLRPGEGVDGLENRGTLVISADSASYVVAPIGGRITSVLLEYRYNFTASNRWFIRSLNSPAEISQKALELAANVGVAPRFISISLTIDRGDAFVYLSGVRFARALMVGMEVAQGDTLGRVGYFLDRIGEPHIGLEAVVHGFPADPLPYLGFRGVGGDLFARQHKVRFTSQEMRAELSIIRSCIVEGDPCAFDYSDPYALDSLFYALRSTLSENYDVDRYRLVVHQLVKFFRNPSIFLDSRLAPDTSRFYYRFPVAFGVLNDSLVVTWNGMGYDRMVGRRIMDVDGIPADTLVRFIKSATRGKQAARAGGGESDIIPQLLDFVSGSFFYFLWYRQFDPASSVSLTLEDGVTVSYPSLPEEKGYTMTFAPSFSAHLNPSRSPRVSFSLLTPDVGYMAVRSFSFARETLDSIRGFLDTLNAVGASNLIVDVQSADDGRAAEAAQLFSMLTLEPFRDHLYRSVLDRGYMSIFRFSEIYRDSVDFFPCHTDSSVVGEYRCYNDTLVFPDSTHHFSGGLYVLINESTASGGSHFAALVTRYARGVLIGRETNTQYYSHSSGPYFTLTLPWSEFTLTVPLVRFVFDTVRHPNIPFGRGVMPDHHVHFSVREFSGAASDTMVFYALRLIEENSSPAKQFAFGTNALKWRISYILAGSAILLFLFAILRRHRRCVV